MNREQALESVKSKVKNKNLQKHMIATEAIMTALAKHFNEDHGKWRLAGLLHDIDYDETKNNFDQHGIRSTEMLKNEGMKDEVILNAIKGHCDHAPRESKMAKALYAVDPLTGLIVACALIHPNKNLASIDTKFVLNRFEEKRFAAGANREQIKATSELGLTLEQFISIGLNAMQSVSKELGL